MISLGYLAGIVKKMGFMLEILVLGLSNFIQQHNLKNSLRYSASYNLSVCEMDAQNRADIFSLKKLGAIFPNVKKQAIRLQKLLYFSLPFRERFEDCKETYSLSNCTRVPSSSSVSFNQNVCQFQSALFQMQTSNFTDKLLLLTPYRRTRDYLFSIVSEFSIVTNRKCILNYITANRQFILVIN